jgi:hypothetical protein
MNYEETLTTLQFASRAIKIKIEAKINEKVETKKENVIDFKNLKSLDLNEQKKIEKETDELKNSINNLKNGLKLSQNKSQTEDIQDSNEIIKKFQMMILHLQNELSKNVTYIDLDSLYI